MRVLSTSAALRTIFALTACVALSTWCTSASAVTITQWNFNTTLGVNNTPAPSTGAGSATPVGMTGDANNADIVAATGTTLSSDPVAAPNDNAWRVRGSTNNGWSGTTSLLSGARFNASTVGNTGITVSMDVHATDGSPRHAQFQYTLDGTTFTSFGALLDFNATFDGFATFSWDLSSIPAADNNPNFGFKLVSAFSPVEFSNANGIQPANTAFQRASATATVYNGTAGNWRFDMVTVGTVPEPTSFAVITLALAGLAGIRRRTR